MQTDDAQPRKRRQRMASVKSQLPPIPGQQVTVIAVGLDTQPKPLGHADPSLDAVHFVQVGKGLVLAGTIEDLRNFVAELGMTVADMEREMIEDLVEEGRRRARNQQRQLA